MGGHLWVHVVKDVINANVAMNFIKRFCHFDPFAPYLGRGLVEDGHLRGQVKTLEVVNETRQFVGGMKGGKIIADFLDSSHGGAQ